MKEVVPQDLFYQPGIRACLVDGEDPSALDDLCKGIIVGCEERDTLLRCEEVGGVGDLAEQFDKRRQRLLTCERCCEVLRRGKRGSECCQWEAVGTHDGELLRS